MDGFDNRYLFCDFIQIEFRLNIFMGFKFFVYKSGGKYMLIMVFLRISNIMFVNCLDISVQNEFIFFFQDNQYIFSVFVYGKIVVYFYNNLFNLLRKCEDNGRILFFKNDFCRFFILEMF